jgi:hypothetical protein
MINLGASLSTNLADEKKKKYFTEEESTYLPLNADMRRYAVHCSRKSAKAGMPRKN